MTMKYPLHLLSIWSVLLLTPAITAAQSIEFSMTGQPKSFVVESRPYVVEGYGAARLGMTVDEVKAVIAKDYPSALSTLKDEVDPLARTRGLAVVVPALAPVQSLGPATISYIFGATTQRLISINVYWLLDAKANKLQRENLVAGGTALASDFVGWDWPILTAAKGHVTGPGVLILFACKDAAGGGVEVRLDGVAFDVEREQGPQGTPAVKPQYRPAPAGPAQLRLSFVANVDMPDIYRIPSGAF